MNDKTLRELYGHPLEGSEFALPEERGEPSVITPYVHRRVVYPVTRVVYPQNPAVPPVPHQAKPEVELLAERKIPTIFLSLPAYQDTYLIIKESGDEELGWLGTVKRLDDDAYLIERIFLFEQDVSASHCNFDQKDLGKFWLEMLKRDPANREMLNSILFWGHLHPDNMTEPSGQDEDQMEVFKHNQFFIRGIFTRGGEGRFTFFNYALGYKVTDCSWRIWAENEERQNVLAAEIQEKKKDPAPPSSLVYRTDFVRTQPVLPAKGKRYGHQKHGAKKKK